MTKQSKCLTSCPLISKHIVTIFRIYTVFVRILMLCFYLYLHMYIHFVRINDTYKSCLMIVLGGDGETIFCIVEELVVV